MRTFGKIIYHHGLECKKSVKILAFKSESLLTEAGNCIRIPSEIAPVVELADTQDLGSCGKPCRFKSCRGQNIKPL